MYKCPSCNGNKYITIGDRKIKCAACYGHRYMTEYQIREYLDRDTAEKYMEKARVRLDDPRD